MGAVLSVSPFHLLQILLEASPALSSVSIRRARSRISLVSGYPSHSSSIFWLFLDRRVRFEIRKWEIWFWIYQGFRPFSFFLFFVWQRSFWKFAGFLGINKRIFLEMCAAFVFSRKISVDDGFLKLECRLMPILTRLSTF